MGSGFALTDFKRIGSKVYARYKHNRKRGWLDIHAFVKNGLYEKCYPPTRYRNSAKFKHAAEFLATLRRLKMQLDDSQGIKRDPEHELATRKHWETFFSGAYPDTWLRYQDEAQHGVIGAQTDTIDTRYEAWMKCTEDFEEWERREKENKEKAVQPPTSVTRT